MIKQSKIRRKTVELRRSGSTPSRIRRDPVPAPAQRAVRPYPTEREVLTTVVGVILFAIALAIITFGISDLTSH